MPVGIVVSVVSGVGVGGEGGERRAVDGHFEVELVGDAFGGALTGDQGGRCGSQLRHGDVGL